MTISSELIQELIGLNNAIFKDASLFATRAVVALIFIWHGAEKAFWPDVGVEKFVNMGFPGFLGPIIGGIEVVLGLLIVVGLATRYATAVGAAIIVVAVIGVQLAKGYQAGLERDLLILAASAILISYGPGSWALRLGAVREEAKRPSEA